MSLRLAPLNKFHTYLCSLNYYEDFKEEIFNPELDKNVDDQTKTSEIQEVPLTFDNADEYARIWKNIFFVEAKGQIEKAEQAEGEAPDNFYLKACDKVEDFVIFSMTKKESSSVSYISNDLVLICKKEPETKHIEHLLGIIEVCHGQEIRVKTVIDTDSEDKRTKAIFQLLTLDSEWFVKKLCNIVTLNREYQALQSIHDLNLKNLLLNPVDNLPAHYHYFEIPEKLNDKMMATYNFSQYTAIKESLKKEGVTLIQGPPGTGKTTTILGVLSVLLNSRNKSEKYKEKKTSETTFKSETPFDEKTKQYYYRKAMPWIHEDDYVDWQDDRENNPFNTAQPYKEHKILLPPIRDETALKPEKILICGPSNAAIDEIIRKITNSGLFDTEGNTYMPSLVRIGPNYHASLRHYSLEYMMEKEREANVGKEKEHIQTDILKKAQIICSTLSVTGSALLTSSSLTFDTVVIDEAAQAVEISTLIPLKYDCKRLILIGDPKQLPATVFSRKSQTLKYDQSLFSRLQLNGYPVHLLQVQYRMHPNISWFISKAFYEAKLLDYEKILDLIGDPEYYKVNGLGPVTFFHVDGEEAFINNTYQNELEAQVVVKCYDFLNKMLTNFDKKKLGIITPYNGQASLIRDLIRENDQTVYCEVEVNSVDSFQGREKDLVIFSTVRSKYEGIEKVHAPSIGFVKDKRRMNVGLSRARIGLVVIGDIDRLRKARGASEWGLLADYCLKEKRCFKVDLKAIEEDFFTSFKTKPDEFVLKAKDLTKKKNENK